MDLQVCTVTGILAVAHATGEVRVYQFSSAAHEVVSLHLSRPDKRARQEEESGRWATFRFGGCRLACMVESFASSFPNVVHSLRGWVF